MFSKIYFLPLFCFVTSFFLSQTIWSYCPSVTPSCKQEGNSDGAILQKLTLSLDPKNLLLGKPVHIFGEDTRKKVPKKNLNKIPYRWTAQVRSPVKGGTLVSTGFLVGPCHLLITNHATTGASKFHLNFQNGQKKTTGTLVKKGKHYTQKKIEGNHKSINDDWAILKLERCMPKGYGCPVFPPMEYKKFFYTRPLPSIQMTSYNYIGNDNTISKNELVVTKKCKVVDFLDAYNKDPYKNLGLNDCPVQAGSSGSPLFNLKNELVGIQVSNSRYGETKNNGKPKYVPEWDKESIRGEYHNYFSHYGVFKDPVNSVTGNQKGCSDRFPSEYK